jgi:hypothetical protein
MAWQGCPPQASYERVASGQIIDLAADGETVFWLDEGKVFRANSGENPVEMAAFEGAGRQIAVDQDFVYWAHSTPGDKPLPSLEVLPRSMGLPFSLVKGTNVDGAIAAGFALSGSQLIVALEDGTLRSLPRDLSNPGRMLRSHTYDLAFRDVAVSGPLLFFHQNSNGYEAKEMQALNVDREALVAVPDSAVEWGVPGAVAADEHHVYFAQHGGGGRLRRATRAGYSLSSFQTLVAGVDATALAVRGEYLYWNDGQVVGRVPRAGGEVERLACGLDLALVAVGDKYVYWAEDGRRILRTKLPSGEPPVEADPIDPVLPPYEGPTHPATLTVRALISGVVHLFLSPAESPGNSYLRWHILAGPVPGFAGTKVKSCKLDGQDWIPTYSQGQFDQFGPYLADCNCDSDTTLHPGVLAAVPQTVTLEAKGRGEIFLAQQPAPENSYTLVVSIDDKPDDGDWYDLTLHYLAEGAAP